MLKFKNIVGEVDRNEVLRSALSLSSLAVSDDSGKPSSISPNFKKREMPFKAQKKAEKFRSRTAVDSVVKTTPAVVKQFAF